MERAIFGRDLLGVKGAAHATFSLTPAAWRDFPGSVPCAETLDWFAVASPGLAPALGEELAALARARPGLGLVVGATAPEGLSFSAGLLGGMAANLHLGVATRVLVRLGEIGARSLGELERKLSALPWACFVRLESTRKVRVEVTVHKCRLWHTGAIAERVRAGLGSAVGVDASAAHDGPVRVVVRGVRDRFIVSMDSSGELLHRRGYRLDGGTAPLRETLAAGILWLAGWTPDEVLVDGMCGAGTIAVEAATRALGLAPGRGRSFAFERWPCFSAEAWATVRAAGQAHAGVRGTGKGIFALDHDARALARARAHAERAGVAQAIEFRGQDLLRASAPVPAGLLVVNPPYGRRLGSARVARALLRELGERLRGPWRGFRAAVLTPDPEAERWLGRTPTAIHALENGGLPIRLLCLPAVGG